MGKLRRNIKKGIVKKEDLAKTSKLEKLSKKILTAFLHKKDEGKVYVNYCSYHAHPGIIGDIRLEEKGCYVNKCPYYRKLTEEK